MKKVNRSDIERVVLAVRSKCKEYLCIFIPLRTHAIRQAYLKLVRSFVGKGIHKSQGFLHLLVVGGILLAAFPAVAGINSIASSGATKQKGYTSADHKAAYKSLSPKNQGAFDSLPSSDQQTVVQTYKNGGDHQKQITTILNNDQKSKDMNSQSGANMQKNANSPASRSMKNQQRVSSKNESNIFNK